MKNFFKSKFFLIFLSIAVILTITSTVLSLLGYSSPLRNLAVTVFTPIRNGASAVGSFFSDLGEKMEDIDALREENEELKRQLALLQESIAKSQMLEEENEWLKQYLDLRDEHTDFTFQQAKITAREAGNYMTLFTLDCGSLHGVAPYMPIITESGVLGYVTEVGINWCKAVTLIETGSSVGVTIERTGYTAILEGVFALESDGMCKLAYLSEETDIQVGDRIVTSGLGEIYPKGLFVGTVEEVYGNPLTGSLEALVKPGANLQETDRVMIIKAYETIFDENAA